MTDALRGWFCFIIANVYLAMDKTAAGRYVDGLSTFLYDRILQI